MCIITSNLNSTFGMIGKVTGIKMTAKAVGQNLSFRVSMKSNLDMRLCSEARLQNLNNFLLLNRFLRLSLNENLLLLNFLLYFFHLVPFIWEF